MTHFSLLVIENDNVSLDDRLAPFHEFESTGRNDQFVQHIDITQRCLAEFASESPDDYPSFASYIEDYYDFREVGPLTIIDFENSHKFGYYIVNSEGVVSKVVERTNPNSKWDYYCVGGRFVGALPLVQGTRANSAQKGDIALTITREQAALAAGTLYDAVHKCADNRVLPSLQEIRLRTSDLTLAYRELSQHPVIIDLQNSDFWELYFEIDTFRCSRDEYVQRARDAAVTAYAILENGVWYQQEKSADPANTLAQSLEWNCFVAKTLDRAPDNAVITIVDCHI